MQKHVFGFMGRRVELWTHPEPDHTGRVIRHTGQFYETDVLMKCRERYWPGTAIIDAGANIGNHAVFFGAILNAPVYAFEPYKPNHDLLEMNIAANGLDGQVLATCCAIGAVDGTGSLQPGPSSNPGTTVVSFGAGPVPVRSLDSLAIPGRIGLLKVDVEGAESAVLMGATALIQTWRPDIVVEAGTTAAFAAVATILAGLGYVPQGRFADTPTYLFVAIDQPARMQAFLAGA